MPVRHFLFIGLMLWAGAAVAAARQPGTFGMAQVLGYPYPSALTATPGGGAIAWVLDERGVRNIWLAAAPDFKPRQLTHFLRDDGQELGSLVFSPDGKFLVFVRGGDHDANWPAPGHLAPDPNSSPEHPHLELYAIALATGEQTDLGQGDAPAISAADNRVAFVHADGSVWWAPIDGSAKPAPLFFDKGNVRDLQWSPDGKTLAFVSDRGDHGFIALYRGADEPIRYLAPSTHNDFYPRWSPDGSRIVFVRMDGLGGAPHPLLKLHPEPWAIWVADVASGKAHAVWTGPERLNGSYPATAGGANLNWGAGDRIVFLADLDGWPHLYSVPAAGGAEPLLLTPGEFMVEDVSMSSDRALIVYNANAGETPGDMDRRHLYKVPVDRAEPEALTSGTHLGWSPVVPNADTVAFIRAGAKTPPLVAVMPLAGGAPRAINADRIPADFPVDELVVPKLVTFKAADGLTVYGQLFWPAHGAAPHPAVIFVHGGPSRQMLLGWHYMGYYSNGYAVNQYLANHGFVVLSVNYRLGIGHGYGFHNPENWGPTGASEYQDVLAGAHYLQGLPEVNADRIGIWGGSYGGYLTALALARNSDIFKAGVDLHGVHDWSHFITHDGWLNTQRVRYEQQDWDAILKLAWESSPVASIDTWKSPVLLIQGDDDRNVPFHQMVDLVQRLKKAGVPYREIVFPNEIHGFLRYRDWLAADRATAAFLTRQLMPH